MVTDWFLLIDTEWCPDMLIKTPDTKFHSTLGQGFLFKNHLHCFAILSYCVKNSSVRVEFGRQR